MKLCKLSPPPKKNNIPFCNSHACYEAGCPPFMHMKKRKWEHGTKYKENGKGKQHKSRIESRIKVGLCRHETTKGDTIMIQAQRATFAKEPACLYTLRITRKGFTELLRQTFSGHFTQAYFSSLASIDFMKKIKITRMCSHLVYSKKVSLVCINFSRITLGGGLGWPGAKRPCSFSTLVHPFSYKMKE